MPQGEYDVTIVGGGLAGMAACVHLAKAGLRAVCIEPENRVRQPAGESLDWSSPGLLSALDLPMDKLIASGIANYKRGATLQLPEGPLKKYRPRDFLGGAPFHIELRTMHVDRQRMDREIQRRALDLGVTLVSDKAVAVEKKGTRIAAVQTALGSRFASPWFIDASGSHTKLLGREFGLPAYGYGPTKIAVWTYFTAPLSHEGTTIYVDPARGSYLNWIWEIPIGPSTLSVGYITTGETIKQKRDEGFSIEDILRRQMERFPRLEALAKQGADCAPRTTSFQCRTLGGVSGPNWIIIGEAASMADPITSNGVTSALRHAAEASALIAEARGKSELPCTARRLYDRRVLYMGRFFNSGIEKMIYDCPVRDGLGLRRAGTVYVGAAWSINGIYSRLRPRSLLSTWAFGALLYGLRGAAWLCYRMLGGRAG